jgi:hypothetical protein
MIPIAILRYKLSPYTLSVFFLALINPFLGALVSLFKVLRCKNERSCFFLIALFLSLVNITIAGEETDYNWYMPLYTDALRTNFSDYMFSLNNAKEPLYTIANYVLAHLFLGNRIAFSLFSTFFFYYCSIQGLLCLQRTLRIERIYLVTSVTFLFFFPYIFANTANLLRQYYATGMILWAIPEILSGNKKFWILALAAVFVHTSSGLLVLLLFLPFLKKSFTLLNSIYYILAYLLLSNLPRISDFLLGYLGNSALSYALMKASTETTFETEYTTAKIIFATIIVLIPLIIVNRSSALKKNELMVRLVNIQFFFYIYILANLEQAELCERLNIYLWCFLPFNLLFITSYYKIRKSVCRLLAYSFFLFLVVYQLFLTQYTYYCQNSFLCSPIISYFIDSKLYMLK